MVFEHDYEKRPELSNSQIDDFGFTSPHVQIVEDFDATVVKVHDGDTVTLRTDFRDFDFPLRMLNIDAPELSEGGGDAQDFVQGRLLGEVVRVLIDKGNRVEKFGRLLGEIEHKGMVIGDEMLHLGLAVPFGSKKEGEPVSLGKMFALKQWLSLA